MSEGSGIRALLIGVAEYDDARFRDVPAAINSVRAMQSVLTDPALCGWDSSSVSVLENPRRPVDVGHALRSAALDSTEILLMYFVGHGTLNEEGELCLAVGESVRSEMEFSGVEYKQLRRILKKSIAKTKIVILDCCYSGKAIEALAGDADIADIAEVSGAYTLTAADQSAHVPSVADPMVRTSFTNAFVDVVRQGVPGRGEFLSLSTIYGRLSQKLRAESLPRPNQRGTDTVANFEFCRNVAHISRVPGVRTIAEQVPRESEDLAILNAIVGRFKRLPSEEFLRCAAAIWKLVDPSSGNFSVVGGKHGDSPSMLGMHKLGPIEDRIELRLVLDARCYPSRRGVDRRAMDNLLSRVRNANFGIFVTTSYVEEEVYRSVVIGQEPIVVFAGRDIVSALKAHGCHTANAVEGWLDGIYRM